MAIRVRPTNSLFLFFFLVFLSLSSLIGLSSAQSCLAVTFSDNRAYPFCTDLSHLGATFHWLYNPNGTADIAFRMPQSSDRWVAWAINPKGLQMVGANAFFAFHDAASSAVTVVTYVIPSYSPLVVDGNLSFVVYSRSAEYANGAYTIYATIDLPGNSTVQNTVYQSGNAFGNSGMPNGHEHTPDHSLTPMSFDFLSGATASGAPSGGTSRLHRKNIHGVLNAISWGVLLPAGVMIARYLKSFPSTGAAWFYAHITCQCTGYILGVSGAALGLKLGSESVGITYHKHRYIGIALFCLATLQVFALLLRPDKKNKYRIYWNLYHWSVGYTVVVLGIINIFKGFDILKPDDGWKHGYIAIISVLGGVALILEAVKWTMVLRRRSSSGDKDDKLAAQDANGHRGGHALQSA